MKKTYFSLRRRTIVTPLWLAGLAFVLVVGASTWLWNKADSTILVLVPSAAGPAHWAEPVGARSGPGAIDAIYAADAAGARTAAAPLGAELGLPVEVVDRDAESLIADALGAHRGGRVVIVANLAAIPELVAAIGDLPVPGAASLDARTVLVIGVPRIGRPNLLRLQE
ncbi:MAG: hypothetical protein KGL36_11755 [Gammaproteobacteria bacterium]|nr:hypothetical protein [Gammaproteobacteria bacterium]